MHNMRSGLIGAQPSSNFGYTAWIGAYGIAPDKAQPNPDSGASHGVVLRCGSTVPVASFSCLLTSLTPRSNCRSASLPRESFTDAPLP